MRLTRRFSRRCVRFVQYVAVFGSLVLLIPVLLHYKDARGDSAARPAVMPGVFVAPDKAGQPGIDVLPAVDTSGDPFGSYRNLPKRDWHDYAAMEADGQRAGKGEGGAPVALPTDAETKKRQDELYRENGFDALASDQISVERSVKDIRHAKCRQKKYIERLPSVTVILPFHNEHNSTLLRSVYSIIKRSPKEMLHQIVLVDDASTKPFLKQPLDDYLKAHGLSSMVTVVRCAKREGLIRARQVGAQHATSEVIVFLDSHSEPNYNWLPPLVEPIALDYRTAVCPFVDVIDCDTFEYRAQDEGARGSFDWEFNYKRLPLRPEDSKDPTAPFPNPVMAGGYFAISRKRFWELGGYDEGLDIWGGEQYELSFKLWQCHGQLLDAPCSRVGHIYRCKYVPFPNPGVGDFISRNYKRVAEVWMDDYKEHLYKRRTAMRNADTGDVSKQREVRERLNCKPFSFFMNEVAFDQDRFYPAVEPPDGANGFLRNVGAGKCVDTQFRGKEERFGLRACVADDPHVGGEQAMRLSFWQDVRPKGRSVCFDVSTSVPQAPVVLFPCHGMKGNQLWKYRVGTQQFFHPISSQCLDCDAERGEVFMRACDPKSDTQKWKWEHLNEDVLQKWT